MILKCLGASAHVNTAKGFDHMVDIGNSLHAHNLGELVKKLKEADARVLKVHVSIPNFHYHGWPALTYSCMVESEVEHQCWRHTHKSYVCHRQLSCPVSSREAAHIRVVFVREPFARMYAKRS